MSSPAKSVAKGAAEEVRLSDDVPGSRIPDLGRIRLAGILTASGLLVELVTVRWWHPIGFMTMLGVGGALIGAGVLLYLYTRLLDRPDR